jgi:hypothetical protein
VAGIRRPGSLTTVLGDVKTKIETLEARGTTTGSSVSSVTPSGNDDASSAPGISSPTPLYLYKRVIKAFIYGSRVTGNTPRMELYFGEDPKVAQGAYVQIQGINGTSTDTWEDMSPAKYAVYAVDTPPWNDGARADQDWRDTPDTGNNGQTVTHTIWFNPDIEVPISYPSTSGRELITTRRIDSVSATGTTVTVNFNSTHVFRVGDVISVDLEDDLYGRDGLFKVSTVVDNNTIEYELETSLASPISLSGTGLGTKYVYPVAHEYVEDGTVWNDTSVSPAKVYVWKEYRWYDTSDPVVAAPGAAAKDGILPSPVTNLTASSTTIPGANGQGGTAEITVSWTAPTTRANGDPIDDYLGGYRIQYKRSTQTEWSKVEAAAGDTSIVIRDPLIRLLTQYDIEVYVFDIMAQDSVAATTSVTTTNFSETLNPPSKPTLATRLGTISVTWDGLDDNGDSPVTGVQYVEVHYSTTSGFTPSPSTLYTTMPITLQGNYVVVSDLAYETDYYFKLVFVRSDGFSIDRSDPSLQETARVAPLVDTDLIESTLNTWPFNGGVVPAGALASGAINAANLFGPNVITQNAISANAIGATQIAAGAIVAGKIAANAITSNEIQANTISAGMIKSNAIEADKIAAGAITASIIGSKEIELKATPTATQRIVLNSSGITAYNGGDTTFFINGVSGTINAASIAVTNITANNITSGTINASVITVDNLNAGNITTGTLNADRIAANSISAGKLTSELIISNIIRTSAQGTARIEIRGSNNAEGSSSGIFSFNGSGGTSFRFYANGVSYLDEVFIDAATVSGTVSGGSFVGGTFRTASGTGQRVIISGTTNRAAFYNTGDADASPTGFIQGTGSGLTINASATGSLSVGGTAILSWNSAGIALSPGERFNSAIDATGAISSDTSITAGTFVRAGNGAGSTLNTNGNITVAAFGTTTLAGNVRGSNGTILLAPSSDARIKTNIETITSALDIVSRLNPVTFDSIVDDTDRRIPGFIAQELEQVFDDNLAIVTKLPPGTTGLPFDLGDDPLRSVEHIHLMPYLVRAIQELSEQNTELQARIATLEER